MSCHPPTTLAIAWDWDSQAPRNERSVSSSAPLHFAPLHELRIPQPLAAYRISLPRTHPHGLTPIYESANVDGSNNRHFDLNINTSQWLHLLEPEDKIGVNTIRRFLPE